MALNQGFWQYSLKIYREVYHQTYNPDSAMRNFKLENNYCGIRSLIEQRKFWREDTERLENAWTYR